MPQLDRKIALVTGAGAGIGRAAAVALAREGASVGVADIDLDGARETARLIEGEDRAAIAIEADVADEGAVRAMVERVVGEFGGLDLGVNNAGIEQSGTPILETTVEGFRHIIDVNVLGVLLCMRHEIPAIRERGGGAIVNLSSIAGLIGFPGAATYVASKHAVLGLTRTAALEHARDNIRVNAICPGAIQTEMIERFTHRDARAKGDLVAQHPLGRIGRPEEVASAIVWLCTEGAGFVTGEHVTIDGGYTAH
jgi:NAD(P)-dependent dehydrogenase (short-subunit alcohol dehydrogenase family)